MIIISIPEFFLWYDASKMKYNVIISILEKLVNFNKNQKKTIFRSYYFFTNFDVENNFRGIIEKAVSIWEDPLIKIAWKSISYFFHLSHFFRKKSPFPEMVTFSIYPTFLIYRLFPEKLYILKKVNTDFLQKGVRYVI